MRYLFRASSLPVLDLPRWIKRLVAISVDVCLCVVSVWIAFYLRLAEFVDIERLMKPALISLLIAVSVFSMTGLYRAIFRYSGWPAILAVAKAMILYGLIYGTIITVIGVDGTPRTIGIIQPLVLFFWLSGSRLFARFWLGGSYRSRIDKDAVSRALIYGAGSAGMQLADGLSGGRDLKVIGFVDDDERLQGRILNGLKISAPESLPSLIASRAVSHVLLAMPSISRARRNQIIEVLAKYEVTVRTLPSFSEIADGKVSISDIKELDLDDLLGRETVEPYATLLSKNITGKTVLVTGAGGSIGSELSRQIARLDPKLLLLIDISEFALYSIHCEIERMNLIPGRSTQAKVVPLLCSVQDFDRVRTIISLWKPATIYHTAAYKHVPLVEHNVVEGVRNNVFGTLNVTKAALENEVQDFVLVSTDKAVRPTNVMGATKRLAEMILQALNAENGSPTSLSMVRFGNVLASSGSVIPIFKSQIASGGPITLTHPEVTRFFMTIPEAAALVIQAGAMAKTGDVFVLDMGQPVKILDLARRMIQLSGLTVRDEGNPDGDIAIQVVGLRPGEKLYEELLIGDNAAQTAHPKIMRASEYFVPWVTLKPELQVLKHHLDLEDVENSLETLGHLVAEFEPEGGLVDRIHLARNDQSS
ncbi:MAG: polysaccharide biosynthesis protein [Gammaproteobacteria bacterium]|nr:polysaccharide biosynthesis protein [Gammaproteobacteria bacterium]